MLEALPLLRTGTDERVAVRRCLFPPVPARHGSATARADGARPGGELSGSRAALVTLPDLWAIRAAYGEDVATGASRELLRRLRQAVTDPRRVAVLAEDCFVAWPCTPDAHQERQRLADLVRALGRPMWPEGIGCVAAVDAEWVDLAGSEGEELDPWDAGHLRTIAALRAPARPRVDADWLRRYRCGMDGAVRAGAHTRVAAQRPPVTAVAHAD